MEDALNLPAVIYDETLNNPMPIEIPIIQECKISTPGIPGADGKEGPAGKEGPPGKEGPQGKTGKSVVDKATTASINHIKANQEIQNKYFKEISDNFKEISDNFTNLFKKIEFIEKKLSEFE